MNKKIKRPPFFVLILSFVIATPFYGVVIIMLENPITNFKEYSSLYLSWIKSKCINMVIFMVLLTSIYYLIMYFYDKRQINKNHDE